MSADEIVQNIKLFAILITILTVTTQIGFLIQKIVVDLRITLISAAISVLIFIILLSCNVVVAFLVSLIIYVSMLDRLLSSYEETFGVILASVIGIGAEILIMINYAGYFLKF